MECLYEKPVWDYIQECYLVTGLWIHIEEKSVTSQSYGL